MLSQVRASQVRLTSGVRACAPPQPVDLVGFVSLGFVATR
jgi:hypothetical protein